LQVNEETFLILPDAHACSENGVNGSYFFFGILGEFLGFASVFGLLVAS